MVQFFRVLLGYFSGEYFEVVVEWNDSSWSVTVSELTLEVVVLGIIYFFYLGNKSN